MEMKIISKQNIKPKSPTPEHLKILKFSVLDQLCAHAYIPFVLLFSNNQNGPDFITKTRDHLKHSLSETLVRFYPLAGEVNDLHIDCNDTGVYYVESLVHKSIAEFSQNPKSKYVRQLFAYDPDSQELGTKKYVVLMQVNIFSCGGIGIALLTTHKLIDAYSSATFLQTWGQTVRGCSENIITPWFDVSHVLPQIPTLPKTASMVSWPPNFRRPKCVPRWFVFDSNAISSLKDKATIMKAKKLSRVVVVVALLWKCIISASMAKNGFRRKSVLSFAVGLRKKNTLSLPNYSIGNIFWFVNAMFSSETELELSSVVGCLQNSIAKIDENFAEEIKGEKGSLKMKEVLRKLEDVYSKDEADYYVATSICNAGFYDVDFGWGKPIKTLHGCPDADNPGLTNLIFLSETESGDGIEALVSLGEEDMKILEHDDELLAFASIKPTPNL
ncbi:hypothetical protein Leryth_009663 [Lithospermum erythrorhizon]|nr:hypothetical protein Leryth_009663 [Lithospermum erythrorhizon]